MKIEKLLLSLSLLILSLNAVPQDFYDTETIQTIEITFPVSNWDQILDAYYLAENDEMLTGSIIINGVPFDSVGVRYKGNSTCNVNNAKNPLHIELDVFINQDYFGFETLKLSNGKNDPSFVREVMSYEICRKYMDAPHANYSKVYINGNYYGLFSNSESVDTDFGQDYLYSPSEATRFKCNPLYGSCGMGSSLMYLGTDSASYYNCYELKSDFGWNDLIELTYNIQNSPVTIESYLDIDRAIWMLAFNNMLVNLDSYTGPLRQNYYLIGDDNNRLVVVPWDMNESLGGFEQINGGPNPPNLDDLKVLDPFIRLGDNTYPLLNLIYNNPMYKRMYIAHCRTMLDENFVNGWYSSRGDSLQAMIYSDLDSDLNKFYSMSDFILNMDSTHTSTGIPPMQTIGVTELMENRITFLNNHVSFNTVQPVITNIVYPDTVYPYTNITITARIENANFAYLGYRHSKKQKFTKVIMYDDGMHNDGSPGDSIYGALINVDESNSHFYLYAENTDAGIFSPQRAEHEYYTISVYITVQLDDKLVINELMSKNSVTHADQNFQYDDWIELYNNTSSVIELEGYSLSDDETDLLQYEFPDTSINPGAYIIIWADGDTEQPGLHTSFKLSADGDALYLADSSLTIVNQVIFGAIPSDMGYARVPNGIGTFAIQQPTFSFNNDSLNFVPEQDIVQNFAVYPNPAHDLITVESSETPLYSVKIYDITGRLIIEESHSVRVKNVSIEMLKQGTYFLKINDSENYKIVKL